MALNKRGALPFPSHEVDAGRATAEVRACFP